MAIADGHGSLKHAWRAEAPEAAAAVPTSAAKGLGWAWAWECALPSAASTPGAGYPAGGPVCMARSQAYQTFGWV
eukprot:365738-Chlamydomonas_euryale.AAC.16